MLLSNTRVIGTGSHIVLCLNGWFGHSDDWGPWEQFLDTESFRWVFPDYRGYGRRIDEDGDFTLDEITNDLLQMLEELGGQTSMSILGHSMGGVFAQHLISKMGRGQITSFVGISPVPASGSPMPAEQRHLFESAETEIGSRRMIIDITTGQRLSDRWLDDMARATRDNSTDYVVGQYFRAWADCDFLNEIPNQEVPALIIVGAYDPAVTSESVRNSYGKTFRDLTTIEFPDSGHYAMYEAPVRLATEIENFLKTHLLNP